MSEAKNPARIMLKEARLAFNDLFKARAFDASSEPKFSGTFLIPKDSPQWPAIEAAINAAAEAKFGEKKAAGVVKGIRGNPNRFCVVDGDTKDYDGYAGHWAIKASNKVQPTLLTRDRTPIESDNGVIYSGCYVNASIEFFGYDNKSQGISASIRGVQFVKDGDAFSGGRPADADEFDELEEEDSLT